TPVAEGDGAVLEQVIAVHALGRADRLAGIDEDLAADRGVETGAWREARNTAVGSEGYRESGIDDRARESLVQLAVDPAHRGRPVEGTAPRVGEVAGVVPDGAAAGRATHHGDLLRFEQRTIPGLRRSLVSTEGDGVAIPGVEPEDRERMIACGVDGCGVNRHLLPGRSRREVQPEQFVHEATTAAQTSRVRATSVSRSESLSITKSAARRLRSDGCCDAMRASASSALSPRISISRRLRSATGASTTITASNSAGSPVSNSNGLSTTTSGSPACRATSTR